MDINSIKVGTIGKFRVLPGIFHTSTEEYDITGVIISTPDQEQSDRHYHVITELGEFESFAADRLKEAKAIRISKEKRDSFTAIAKKYLELYTLQAKKKEIEKQIKTTSAKIEECQKRITHASGYYTKTEFDIKMHGLGFSITQRRCDDNGDNYVMLQQSSEGERYCKPDISKQFPFAYQEYDGVCFIDEKRAPTAYKKYIEQNAPKINPVMKKIAEKVEQDIVVGDKYIYATTGYWVHFKNGFTVETVDKIVKTMKGEN